MPVRLIDVAERAGVSIATASRSLNGAPGVSPAVAERVREVAESMGFVANSHARSLAGGQESSVGLVVGRASNFDGRAEPLLEAHDGMPTPPVRHQRGRTRQSPG